MRDWPLFIATCLYVFQAAAYFKTGYSPQAVVMLGCVMANTGLFMSAR